MCIRDSLFVGVGKGRVDHHALHAHLQKVLDVAHLPRLVHVRVGQDQVIAVARAGVLHALDDLDAEGVVQVGQAHADVGGQGVCQFGRAERVLVIPHFIGQLLHGFTGLGADARASVQRPGNGGFGNAQLLRKVVHRDLFHRQPPCVPLIFVRKFINSYPILCQCFAFYRRSPDAAPQGQPRCCPVMTLL